MIEDLKTSPAPALDLRIAQGLFPAFQAPHPRSLHPDTSPRPRLPSHSVFPPRSQLSLVCSAPISSLHRSMAEYDNFGFKLDAG